MRTIVITGTDRGLGHALAELSLEAGDRVIATYREDKSVALRPLAERCLERLSLVHLELGDATSIAAAARRIRELTPGVDVLLNNAGILGDIEFSVGDPQFEPDEVLETIRINAIGPLRLTHELWDLLVAGRERLLVNISSEAGSIAQNWRDRWFGYCMSKAALNMEAALIHKRLLPLGGRAMQVHPGYVRSYMHGAKNEKATYEPEEAARLVLAAIAQRATQPVGERPDYFDLNGKDLPW
jgi:NAD(P)-dependent dehydrogenase (short-subunit alcohol dehydrogenase family)